MSRRTDAHRAGRRWVLGALLGIPAVWLRPPARAAENAQRWIRVFHAHTGEALEAVYHDGTDYVPAALGRLDWALRDHRTHEFMPIRRELFDLLHELAASAGVPPHYQIISAYRSPATNAMLAATTEGVSPRSLHMDGRAVDVRLEGVATAKLRDLALARQAGGVGYYPKSDFVHLDLGRVRSWSG